MQKKRIISLLLLFLLSLFLINSIYQKEILKQKELNTTYAYFLDGVETYEMPKKNDGYYLSGESHCNNGVTLTWNDTTWSAKLNFSKFQNNKERTRCELYFTKEYKETLLNGTDPVLKDELIPVTIEDDGTVHKADRTKEWYQYKEKKWANAVILKDESISYFNEEIIPEENIESYFVWIPRYKYQIFNDTLYDGLTTIDESKVQIINIEFENKNITPSNGTRNSEWLTHPAFTSFDSNGFWVGKFETSKSNDKEDNSRNGDGVQIKPNVTSWRNIQVGNAFYTTYDYKRNLDSHMMKNMEWGAVAYLQHSEYGSHESVRFNNNSDYQTGYASTKEPTCGYTTDNRDCNKYGTTSDITLSYNTETGYLASTTGNITGIYDLSGGSWEYMMSVMVDFSSNPLSGLNITYNSGFIGNFGESGKLEEGYSFPESKYYDTYSNNSSNTAYFEYTRRKLGDATGEMGPFGSITYDNNITRRKGSWYADHSHFVWISNPWFIRGGDYNYGSGAGLLAFGIDTGSEVWGVGFRVILTPTI